MLTGSIHITHKKKMFVSLPIIRHYDILYMPVAIQPTYIYEFSIEIVLGLKFISNANMKTENSSKSKITTWLEGKAPFIKSTRIVQTLKNKTMNVVVCLHFVKVRSLIRISLYSVQKIVNFSTFCQNIIIICKL